MGVYDPRLSIFAFNGVPLSGFAPGTFIKITKRKPTVVLEEAGPDGEAAFVTSGDQTYDVELTLQKASPSNTILSQFRNATAKGVAVVGAITYEQLSTGTTFSGKQSMITEGPPMEEQGGDKMGQNVWKFAVKDGNEDIRGFTS